MKKISFLSVLLLVLLLLGCWSDEIDVTDTGFEYDVEACDKYFELVECIIDNDDNPYFNDNMRIELKKELKNVQEEWKQLSESELTKKCTESLNGYKNDDMKESLDHYGCSLE